MDDHQILREGVAQEYKIALFRQYGEEQAAAIIGIDLTTLKRRRRAGKVPFVALGERQIRYFGYQIADILILGDAWADTQSVSTSSDPTGLDSGKALQPGTDAGLRTDGHDALRLARQALKKPSRP